jgi:NAD(P)-dependent dehydrogenase (short-subunit alcohol dehydrogenase family)
MGRWEIGACPVRAAPPVPGTATLAPMPTAVVTGSQSGMGLAIRGELAAQGWRVLGVDLPGKGAEVSADLSTDAGRAAAAEALLAACEGRLDAVAANAGVDVPRPELAFGVNYFGVVDLLARLRPALVAAGRARVAVNVSNSIFVTPGIPLAAVQSLLDGNPVRAARLLEAQPALAYQVSKLAVARWIRESAPSPTWAGAGISVNGVCPGPVMTPLLERDLADPRKGPMIRRLPRPLGEFTTPEAVAGLFAFLLSERARFLVICIDGGNEAAWRASDWPRAWGIELSAFRRLLGP